MSDLIDRLNDHAELEDIDHDVTDDCRIAATEIRELRMVINRLRDDAQHMYTQIQDLQATVDQLEWKADVDRLLS